MLKLPVIRNSLYVSATKKRKELNSPRKTDSGLENVDDDGGWQMLKTKSLEWGSRRVMVYFQSGVIYKIMLDKDVVTCNSRPLTESDISST